MLLLKHVKHVQVTLMLSTSLHTQSSNSHVCIVKVSKSFNQLHTLCMKSALSTCCYIEQCDVHTWSAVAAAYLHLQSAPGNLMLSSNSARCTYKRGSKQRLQPRNQGQQMYNVRAFEPHFKVRSLKPFQTEFVKLNLRGGGGGTKRGWVGKCDRTQHQTESFSFEDACGMSRHGS